VICAQPVKSREGVVPKHLRCRVPRLLCYVCGKSTTTTAATLLRRGRNNKYTMESRAFGRHKGCYARLLPCGACGKSVALSPAQRYGLANGRISRVFCNQGHAARKGGRA
jgi:hypothetical protein